MDKSDRNLIDAHCLGDEAAFGELVRRYGGGLLGYLVRVTGDRDRAEDVFQETFKRVHEKASTFRTDNFKGWLYRIGTNVALDGFRKDGRLKMLSLDRKIRDGNHDGGGGLDVSLLTDGGEDPSMSAEKQEQIRQVRRAVVRLPARQRATLVLAYYEQMSYTEVAKVLGCSYGTVKTQMFRALKTLARRLPEASGELS